MRHDEHLLTAALRLVRQSAALTPQGHEKPGQSAFRPEATFEPHCLNDWAEMVKATDEMVRAAG